MFYINCVLIYACVPVSQHACGGERITFGNWFSYNHVESWNQIQVVRLGSKHLYLLSNLVRSPSLFFQRLCLSWSYIWGISVAGISLCVALSSSVLVLSVKWFRPERKVGEKGSSSQNSRRYSQGWGQAKTKGTSVEETILMGWWWTMAREITVPPNLLGGLYSIF